MSVVSVHSIQSSWLASPGEEVNDPIMGPEDFGDLFEDPEVVGTPEVGVTAGDVAAALAEGRISTLSPKNARVVEFLRQMAFGLTRPVGDLYRNETEGRRFTFRGRLGDLAGFLEELANTTRIPPQWLPDVLYREIDTLPGFMAEQILGPITGEGRSAYDVLSGEIQALYARWREPGRIFVPAATLATLGVAAYHDAARGWDAGRKNAGVRFAVAQMVYGMGTTFRDPFFQLVANKLGLEREISEDFVRARFLTVMGRFEAMAATLTQVPGDPASQTQTWLAKARNLAGTVVEGTAFYDIDLDKNGLLSVPGAETARGRICSSRRIDDEWYHDSPLIVARMLWEIAKDRGDVPDARDRIVNTVRLLNGGATQTFYGSLDPAERPAAQTPRVPLRERWQVYWKRDDVRAAGRRAIATGGSTALFALAGVGAEGLVLAQAPYETSMIAGAPLNTVGWEAACGFGAACLAAGALDVYLGALEGHLKSRLGEARGFRRAGWGLALGGVHMARRVASYGAIAGGLQLVLQAHGLTDFGQPPSVGYALAATAVGAGVALAGRHLLGAGSLERVLSGAHRFRFATGLAGRTAALTAGRLLRVV